jgi:HTH-type transcriptional regulator / antitoxin HigA
MSITIKPIHTATDHAEALARIESLWDAKPGTRDGDTLEVLATLVDAYERQHTPILPPDPIEAILFRLEQQGKSRKELEPILGTRARVSEILNGTRALSLAMIRRLHRDLRIPLEVLVSERKVARLRGRKPAKRRSSEREKARRSARA